jgi:hypothetical protein
MAPRANEGHARLIRQENGEEKNHSNADFSAPHFSVSPVGLLVAPYCKETSRPVGASEPPEPLASPRVK